MAKASDYKIATDAGHYLTTAGKETPFIPELGRAIKEYEFNAPTVTYLNEELKRCGFNVYQVNSPDADTPLRVRTDRANYQKADILVSIHYDAMDFKFDTVDPEGHSAHIYPKSVQGRKLAEHIMKYLVLGTPQKNRGIIEQNLHMTRESNMPAVLVECGFMDSKKEYKYMLDENFQKEVASEVAMGICSYFNVPYVMPTPVGGIDWDNKPMDSFVTKRELLQILGKLPSPEIPKPINPKSIRKYNTNIHIFEVGVDNKLDMDLGVRWEREKVSKIVQDKIDEGLDILCAINCGMFSYKEGSEHNTLYIDEGLYYNPPSGETMDFIYYKDGTTKIENIKGYDREKLSYLQNNAHWAIGTSYSLVQNGKINLENAEKFSHANSKEPRTQFGQLTDGSFILVVTDGRTGLSAGLTAHEQAELMLSLGCINAVNVDGGGSSVMVVVVDGVPHIVNQLASGVERKVGSVMIAYQKGWV